MCCVPLTCDVRIEPPARLPGLGIERDDDVVRRAQIERVADLDRRHLVGELAGIARPLQVAGMNVPGDFQLRSRWRGVICAERRPFEPAQVPA